MSKKFEKLLDLVVNEEMDQANELFHELVVEMSRTIYENMIAEDEFAAMDHDQQEVEEESTMEIGGDAADDMIDDVEDHDAMDAGEDDMDAEDAPEELDDRVSDLEDALEELKAEFESLMADEENEPEHNDGMEDPDFADMDDMGDDESEEEPEEESRMHMESRRLTREYHEKVAPVAKAETGDGKSGPVSSAAGRPSTSAKANNIAQGGQGTDTKAGVGGLLKKGGAFVPAGTQNVDRTAASGYKAKAKAVDKETAVNDKSVVGS